jgi:hypothetical protein
MAVTVARGQTVVEVKRTSVEDAENTQTTRAKHPPFWEFHDSLSVADWGSKEYETRLYRGTRGHAGPFCGVFYEPTPPEKIQSKFGGGPYVLYFKVGSEKQRQLRYCEELEIEGQPLTGAAVNANGSSAGLDATSQMIAMFREEMRGLREEIKMARGGDAAAKAVENAVGLTAQVFGAATNAATGTLARIADAGHQAPASNPLYDELMKAMINKMLNPIDPIETFGKMLTAVKGLGIADQSRTSLAIELARQIPVVTQSVTKGLEEWRLAMEANARAATAMRGPGADARPITVSTREVPGSSAPPAKPYQAEASAAPPPGGVAIPMEIIEVGLANILTNPLFSIEDAAYRAIGLMEDLIPGMPDKVVSFGEEQILALFTTRPLLLHVPKNPRLTEFVKKFIEIVKNAPVAAAQEPAAVPQA